MRVMFDRNNKLKSLVHSIDFATQFFHRQKMRWINTSIFNKKKKKPISINALLSQISPLPIRINQTIPLIYM